MAATCVATALEERRPLPVDAIILDPIFTSTHAITIDAPPEQVWPWIAQMGAGRAGWYSWDAIDNGGTPSATRVVPELQTLIPGDIMPAVPGATDAFVVSTVEPPRDLVLTVPDGHGGNAVAWEHTLVPLGGGRTRLVVRGRASARWLDRARVQPPAGPRRIFIERAYALLAHLPRPLLIGFAALGHRVMEARHLRGIQRRATASGQHGATTERWRRFLLTCGILAPVLYVAMTLFVGLLWEGYSVVSGVPSELAAIGAPTRLLWMWLGAVYAVLMVAFGWIPMVLALLVILTWALLYWFPVRRWMNQWGATPSDLARVMAGDSLLADPTYSGTMAVIVNARPEHLWPWLVQIGYQRGGLYSYDWLDRLFGYLDRPSATRILPDYQHLAVGDHIPLGRGPSWPVAVVEPNRALVLDMRNLGGLDWVWQFGLYQVDETRTQLVSRSRVRAQAVWARLLTHAIEPAGFLMTRRMLLGLKQRAEALGAASMGEAGTNQRPAA